MGQDECKCSVLRPGPHAVTDQKGHGRGRVWEKWSGVHFCGAQKLHKSILYQMTASSVSPAEQKDCLKLTNQEIEAVAYVVAHG